MEHAIDIVAGYFISIFKYRSAEKIFFHWEQSKMTMFQNLQKTKEAIMASLSPGHFTELQFAVLVLIK